ncbi:MAG: alanine racemase [SAR324 cluster bacterium]|nr:alanine racemase [SAR324 cluster bacterium]
MRNTRAVIDLSRLERNYNRLLAAHGAGSIMIVLKANAYGHGMIPAGRFLAGLGHRLFAVAVLDEAIALRHAGIKGRILVLGPHQPGSAPEYPLHRLEMTVASLHHLDALAGEIATDPPPEGLDIHLKLDTGMGRIGLQAGEVSAARALLAKTPAIRLRAVYSHFAESEKLGSGFCDEQLAAFEAARAELLQGHGGAPSGGTLTETHLPEAHLANSAGLLRDPRYHFDYARVGYALWAPLVFDVPADGPPEPPLNRELEPVMTLSTRITHLKTMPAGATVGYGRTHTCREGEVIATLPIGYGDGYFRQMSNEGYVSIAGRRHPIAGRVSMDQTTVSLGVGDLTAKIGDEVILLGGVGDDGSGGIPVAEAAGWLGTIDYEVLTQLSARIPRRYVYAGVEVDLG